MNSVQRKLNKKEERKLYVCVCVSHVQDTHLQFIAYKFGGWATIPSIFRCFSKLFCSFFCRFMAFSLRKVAVALCSLLFVAFTWIQNVKNNFGGFIPLAYVHYCNGCLALTCSDNVTRSARNQEERKTTLGALFSNNSVLI